VSVIQLPFLFSSSRSKLGQKKEEQKSARGMMMLMMIDDDVFFVVACDLLCVRNGRDP
ncbi:MAG: hypothetical protein ACI90V_008438, partial [Bacillariaceae sp.]|jgi:hypothetical protein